MQAIMNTYGRLPVTFVSGQGSWLLDSEGRRYLDALSGIAVCGLGHAHPAVSAAIREQADKLIHTSNLYSIERQQALADALVRVSGMDNVFFSNSGAEANEAAIKIARKYGHDKGIHEPVIIVMTKAFHGRTMGTLTATGNTKVQEGFGPLLNGFIRVPYMNLDAIRHVIAANANVVAVMLEPVQGEGGLATAPADYLKGVRALCDEHQLLMLMDEVQTGNGRTGTYFCYQHYGFKPDVVTTAKGLGNGVPIGACLAQGVAADVLKPGNHGSTYGGNPLACAAALAVVETIEKENLCKNAEVMGAYLRDGFTKRLAGSARLKEIRGLGLMIGLVLNQDCPTMMADALKEGLLLNVTSGNVVRLLPPLNVTQAEADQIIETVSQLIEALS
ncbi:aspartate aminotransferase family protein [Thalassolituus sp. LLYu03]|uniref:aspartate aminotransferase family protein n=1 Tax=Thalassolituus sp. LLYu03 TaxID=3421656 RepID=UPI003D2CB4B5